MHLVPKTDNPAYAHDRCQCLECGYIFLRTPNPFLRILGMVIGESCPNCTSRKTISLAKMAPQQISNSR